jgi:hypothetical protein
VNARGVLNLKKNHSLTAWDESTEAATLQVTCHSSLQSTWTIANEEINNNR